MARQEDVTIYSDKLVIYYGDKQDQVDKIEAIGSVRILQTNRIGTGDMPCMRTGKGRSPFPAIQGDSGQGFHYRQGDRLLSG